MLGGWLNVPPGRPWQALGESDRVAARLGTTTHRPSRAADRDIPRSARKSRKPPRRSPSIAASSPVAALGSRSSGASPIASPPRSSSFQRSCGLPAPGNRQAIPTTAIGPRCSPVIPVIATSSARWPVESIPRTRSASLPSDKTRIGHCEASQATRRWPKTRGPRVPRMCDRSDSIHTATSPNPSHELREREPGFWMASFYGSRREPRDDSTVLRVLGVEVAGRMERPR